MNRLSTIAALVAFAIFATLLMFLTALIVYELGPAAIYFVWGICVPFECVLLFMGTVVMVATQATVLHSLKLRRSDEEHMYQMLRRKRELDLQKRRIQLHLYQHHLSGSIYTPRRPKIRPRPPDDLTANGC